MRVLLRKKLLKTKLLNQQSYILNMKKIILLLFLLIYGFVYAQSIWFEGFESPTFPPSAAWNIIDISGTKTWARSTDYAHSGNASAEHGWLAGSVQASALITPAITVPNYGSPELDFWSRIQLIGYNNSSKILVSTTVNSDINAFTEIKTLSGDEVTIAAWRNIIIPLDAFLGQTIYIAFLYTADDGPRWFIDDININHFASFVDIQPFGITPISGDYPLLSTNEQITVRIKNNGGSTASSFNLKLFQNGDLMATETFTGSIPSLGEATHTFNATLNLSAAGLHKVQVVTNLTGDQVPANDTATVMINNLGCNIHTSFPFFEGFEDNGNNLPPCWTQEYVAENYNWRVFNAQGAQGIPGLEPVGAFEGEYKAVFYTNGKDGAITKLIAPPMNLTLMSNPVLKFHHVQQHYAGYQDSLKVYYRTSAHGTWVLLAKYKDMIVDWTERILPLPEPSSQYSIAFEGYAEWGHSVQLDNIIVEDYVDTDIAVTAITPSGLHVGLSNKQIVTATIKNNGRDPVGGFDISLYLNDSFVTTEIFSGTIQGVEEIIYTFNATVDLSVSGTYLLRVAADLEGDEVPENNELTVIVKNLVCDALTFPYDEGFEEEIFPPHCWTLEGNWQRLTYGAHTGIGRASYAWWYGTLGWLISPKFSIPAGGECLLEFWSHVYEAKFHTHSEVMISTTNNNPSSFTLLHALSGAEIPESEWVKIAISLEAYAGKNIYIAFRYRSSGGQTGHMWSLDDIKVSNLNNYIDAEVVNITAPLDYGMNLTSAEPVTVQIRNNGGAPMSDFQLILEFEGSVVATENYIGYINSMASANYTFAQKLDLSAEGVYTIKVTVDLPEDMNPNNDSMFKTVENKVTGIILYSGNPLVAWISNDKLYVKGLEIGEYLNLYSVTGQLIFSNVVYNEIMCVNLNTQGFYIVQSGSRVLKVVY
jgi:hypothetical protein